MDIRSAIDKEVKPGETVVVPTGLKMAIPKGYELQVRPRSGLSLKTPLRIANAPGTIDSGYRDEIGVIVTNTSLENDDQDCDVYLTSEKGNKQGTYLIKAGDRIAQIVLCKFETIHFEEVDKGAVLNIGTNRGGGFGHTGVK